MNLTEVKKSLERQLSRELAQGNKRNIVFWYDEEGVFTESIDTLSLDNAKIIKLYDDNMFAVKLYIEETDRESNLLVYSPLPRPDNRDNWLTDTIRYSQTFSTDETSLNLLNFNIDNALRSVVAKYKLFFRHAERCKKFEGYGLAPYSEPKIDLGVLSVLCKLTAPNLDGVVRVLLVEMVQGESDIYDSIVKFDGVGTLWDLIEKSYGYKNKVLGQNSEASLCETALCAPDVFRVPLEKLAIILLCSHLSHSINGNIPKEWQGFVSDNPNCYVFVDNFMKDSRDWMNYNLLAAFVAEKLDIRAYLARRTIDEIVECDTFEDFDRNIINRINENITQNAGEYAHYRKVINSRKNRRYYLQFEAEYDTLLYACEYLNLAVKYKELQGISITALFDNYVKEYYKADSSYRHFITSYDRLTENESFRNLLEMVENSYTNWFLNELAMKWCALWDDEERQGQTFCWQLPGVTSQQGFYEKYVRRFVSDNERLIVIISDGLRYESAVELNAILNREQRGSSELDTMLGVIPSYTSLGMASLLPNKQLEITDKGDFTIQGISTEGTENRGKILRLVKKESIAIKYEEVMDWKATQLPEKLSGLKLIYIFHNTIDARGDNSSTENEVFDATEKAFKELSVLVSRLQTYISPVNVFITADHGYIYRRTPLAERDKTPKEALAGVKGGRRFLLANENIEMQGTQNFSMEYLTKDNNDMYVILPRITNCFKLSGAGSRYVHGGASLQEVAIPVIRFKSDKNAWRSLSAKKVTLGLTNLSRKVTSVITHLTFFQADAVDDKHLPLRVTAYFADEFGNRISNENIIIADSSSNKPEDRVYKEKFTLKDMAYDKGTTYYLIIKDDDELVSGELEKIPFVIDLVFGGSIKF